MKWTAVLGAIVMTGAAWAGGMTSTGGDSHKWGYESAWFLGTQPVSYCIAIAPSERITEGQVKSDFESAVKIWKDYYEERVPRLHDGDHKLNFSFMLETCQPSTRLVLYIGVINSEIQRAKSLYENPYAFAYRSEFDLTTGLGRGFVWFAPSPGGNVLPEWSLHNVFHGMLLHELGHVYGCGHVANTIMAEDMISNLQTAGSDDPNWAAYGKMYMTHIDHHYILLFNDRAKISLKGQLHLNADEAKVRFLRLVGRAAVGKVVAQFDHFQDHFELTLSDDAGKTTFEIAKPSTNATSFSMGNQVFFSVRGNTGFSTGTSGLVYWSNLKTKRGETLVAEVAINPNELGWPVRIRYMDGGVFKEVFQADLWMTAGLPR